jgi:hypothetical protein
MRTAVLEQLSPDDVQHAASNGTFSFVEYNSGSGSLSMAVAAAFPQATVVSIEPDEARAAVHLGRLASANVSNNYVCTTVADASFARKLHKSPEFFRVQVQSLGLLELLQRQGRDDAGEMLGLLFGSAMTTLLPLQSAAHWSLAFTTFFHTYPDAHWHVPERDATAPAVSSLVELGDAARYDGIGGDGTQLPLLRFGFDAHPRCVRCNPRHLRVILCVCVVSLTRACCCAQAGVRVGGDAAAVGAGALRCRHERVDDAADAAAVATRRQPRHDARRVGGRPRRHPPRRAAGDPPLRGEPRRPRAHLRLPCARACTHRMRARA